MIQITSFAVDALFAPLNFEIYSLDFEIYELYLWSSVHVLLFLSLRRAYGEPPVKTLTKQACLVALYYVVRAVTPRLVMLIGLRYHGNDLPVPIFSLITVATAVTVLLLLAGVALGVLLYGLARRGQAGAT